MRFPSSWLALLGCALLPLACKHTYQEKIEPTKEQKLELYTTTASYLYEDGSLDRAQDQAVKALEIDPENKAMRRMIGWIRLRKNTRRDVLIAERFFRDLVADEDSNDNTMLGLAIACERLGRAADDDSRALADGSLEPAQGKDRDEVARELAEKARALWHESIALCEGLLEKGEGNTNAMNALQRVQALAGNYEESLEWSRRLLERTDGELEAWRRMLREKDLTRGEEAAFRKSERAAVDLQTETHLFAATLLFHLARYEEALAHLDALVGSSPEMPQAYSIRAQVRARAGQYSGAVEDLDRYLALSDAPYEDPDIKRAFELRAEAQKHVPAR